MKRGMMFSPLVIALAGLLFGCVLGAGLAAGLLLIVSGEPRAFTPPPVVTEYAIEAAVEEAYINRILVESANDMSSYVSLAAGRIDLKPGSIGDFRVQLEAGPLRPVVEGRVGFQPTRNGSSIEVVLLDVRIGRLQLASVLPSGLLDATNRDIERLIVGRIGAHGLKIMSVGSDEDTLRLQFGPE
jgi:hypothetical protein